MKKGTFSPILPVESNALNSPTVRRDVRTVQRREKRFVRFAKQESGRARQKFLATTCNISRLCTVYCVTSLLWNPIIKPHCKSEALALLAQL